MPGYGKHKSGQKIMSICEFHSFEAFLGNWISGGVECLLVLYNHAGGF